MLKIKSFEFSDDAGMNELLSQYRLAEGAHILVSNGLLCIPYDDGEPMNESQHRIFLKEQKNKMVIEKELIEHSNAVLEKQVEQMQVVLEEELEEEQANLAELENSVNAKGKTEAIKNQKAVVDRLISNRSQLENQVNMNKQEIERFDINIAEFDKRLGLLG